MTPERLAEIERALTKAEDDQYARELRAMIEEERAKRERAEKHPPAPENEKRWIVIASLPALPAN